MDLVQNHNRSLDVLQCGIVLNRDSTVLCCSQKSKALEVGESV
jgi:hypothetical protein